MSYYNEKKVVKCYYNGQKIVSLAKSVNVIINITAKNSGNSNNVRFFSGDSDVIAIVGTRAFTGDKWSITGGSILGHIVEDYTHTQQIPLTSRKTIELKGIPIGSVLSFYHTGSQSGKLNGVIVPENKQNARDFTITKNTTFEVAIDW